MRKKAERHFLGKAFSRELKKWKAGEIGDLSWLASYAGSPAFPFFCAAISELINENLKSQGLWHRDGDGVVLPEENGIPSLEKRKSFSQEASKYADDSIYDPESVDKIYEEARIAEGANYEEEEIGAAENEPGGDSLHPYLPKLAVSSSRALMRRYPLDLKNSLARDLFDSFSFLNEDDRDLLPALCFFEVGINDAETFQHIWEDAYKNGPHHKSGKEFSYSEYQKDQLRLFHRLKRAKENYFKAHPYVKDRGFLWERFEKAFQSLTRKQWHVLKQVRVKKRPQAAVARKLRISLDSLRNRLEAAELKFRRALTELADFFPSTTYRKSAKSNYIYDGLFDKREKARPLYRIDPKTGERIQIPLRVGKLRLKPGVNAALIKAWAHDSTPVPDFSFTEFFTQLYPKGAIDRISASDTAHDRASGSFTERLAAHRKQRKGES